MSNDLEKPTQEYTIDQLREKLKDPKYLPSFEEIIKTFKFDIGKSSILGLDLFRFCCEDVKNPIFEFINQEYIEHFSNYLTEKITEYGATQENPLKILEAGAGNGRLTYFIQQKLDQKIPGLVNIIATDAYDGSWYIKPLFPVEKLDHEQAVKKYQPHIVIVNWMSLGLDMTPNFRTTDSVQEYILIGETDGGCCGSEDTWGFSLNWDEPEEAMPEYAQEGFERHDLIDLAAYQICRTDYPGGMHSMTVSFRRKK